tara:strand:+ start:970 stop:2211 length:1242 start_codon:yes stop_codon:yes gene_type:complete
MTRQNTKKKALSLGGGLLPAAKLHVFSHSDALVKTAETLAEDWRYGRVTYAAQDAGLEEAATHYASHKSPDLLIIQVDKIDNGLTAQLEALAAVCEPHTDCLLVGPVNDVQLYRKLTEMGVSDYLVAPVSAEDMHMAITRVLLKKKGQEDSRLLTFIGSKGGVGASTLAHLTAENLAASGQKTVLVDCAGGWTDFPVALGFEPVDSLHALVKAAISKDTDAIDRLVIELTDRLYVAATGAQKLLNGAIDEAHFEALLDYLLAHFPHVVLDLSGAPEPIKTLCVKRASEIGLVSDASLTALRVARTLRSEVKELRGGDMDAFRLIINKQGLNKAQEANLKEISEGVGQKPDIILPYSGKAFAARDMNAKPLSLHPEMTDAVKAIKALFLNGEVADASERKAGGIWAKLGLGAQA